MFNHKPPKSIVPKKTNFEFMDIDPIEVARQMTLIDSEYFRSIRPYECMGQPWNKPNATTVAPNITKMIHRFNQVSNWVTTQIVQGEKAKGRSEVLQRMITVAQV